MASLDTHRYYLYGDTMGILNGIEPTATAVRTTPIPIPNEAEAPTHTHHFRHTIADIVGILNGIEPTTTAMHTNAATTLSSPSSSLSATVPKPRV